MKYLISPSIPVLVLQVFYVLILLGLTALLVRSIIRNLSKKSHRVPLLIIALSFGVLQSCSQLGDSNPMPQSSLIKEFGLRVMTKEETKKMESSSLHFNSEADARKFLESYAKASSFEMNNYPAFTEAYSKGIPQSLKDQIVPLSYSSKRDLIAQVIEDDPNDDVVRRGKYAASGSGSFSQAYTPWMSISVSSVWENHRVTNFNSQFTGLTVGASWNQLSSQQVGERQADGSFRVAITYTESFSLFYEGAGTIYVSEIKVAYVTIRTSESTQLGAGGGENYGRVLGGRIVLKPWID